MNTIRLKVKEKQNVYLPRLLNEMGNLPFRMRFDVGTQTITVENTSEQLIATALDLVRKYYEIVEIETDNQQELSLSGNNACLEDSINKVWKASHWAMYQKCISEYAIRAIIEDTAYLISKRYSKKDCVSVKPGDIVRIHYGQNLQGEVSGKYTRAVICKVDSTEPVVYVVPIVSNLKDIKIYMEFDAKNDIETARQESLKGYVIFEKGRYLYAGRIIKKVGTLKREYFDEVLRKLPMAFDFTANDLSTSKAVASYKQHSGEESPRFKSRGYALSWLNEAFGARLEEIKACESMEEKVNLFLQIVEFSDVSEYLKCAFLMACETKKITYNDVLPKVIEVYPDADIQKLREEFQEYLKEWKKGHEGLRLNQVVKKVSITAFWKLFVKYANL